jgi:hypothetical protein
VQALLEGYDEETEKLEKLRINAATAGVDIFVFAEEDFATCILCSHEMVQHNSRAAKEALAAKPQGQSRGQCLDNAEDVHPGTFVRGGCVPCGHAHCCMRCLDLLPRESRAVGAISQVRCPGCSQYSLVSYAPFQVIL